jgi:DNA-binding PadR family transcriptional regulator
MKIDTWSPRPNHDRLLRLLYRMHILKNPHFQRRYSTPTIGGLKYIYRLTGKLLSEGYISEHFQPVAQNGRPPTYYRLTPKAIAYLRETGTDIPLKQRGTDDPPHFLFLEHTFSINDFLIALELFEERTAGVELLEVRHDQELKRAPDYVETADGRVGVACDAWFRLTADGEPNVVAVEIDRGTEDQKRWRRKVRALVAWVAGPYREHFADLAKIAVIAVPGAKRADDLKHWTELELMAMKSASNAQFNHLAWGELFYFTDRDPGTTEPSELFAAPVWYQAFSAKPVTLIDGVAAASS